MAHHRLAATVLCLVILGTSIAAIPEPREVPVLNEIPSQQARDPEFKYVLTERAKNLIIMRSEIVEVWELYLDQEGYSLDDARVEELDKLAWYLALAIDKYQRTPVNWQWWNPRREGSTLPKNADTHLVLAVMAGFESKIDPDTIGDLGEAGILQCHRWCRNGHSKQELVKNPQLAIDLAVGFLAKSIDQCGIKIDSLATESQRDSAWSKPLALYGAGKSALKNGRCVSREFARARVYHMKKFRKLIRD